MVATGTPLCFEPSGCPNGVGLLDVATATSWINDREPLTFNKLTPYDDLSVMNYCADVFGRTDHQLSAYDRLGVEMLYPGNRYARGIVFQSGAAFILGDRILTRTDVAVSLTTDWTARGALDSFFSSMNWYVDGSFANGGLSGTFLLSTPGTHTAYVSFSDTATLRTHSGSTLVEANNSRHAALIRSSLSATY